jgi:hypothetical protein
MVGIAETIGEIPDLPALDHVLRNPSCPCMSFEDFYAFHVAAMFGIDGRYSFGLLEGLGLTIIS